MSGFKPLSCLWFDGVPVKRETKDIPVHVSYGSGASTINRLMHSSKLHFSPHADVSALFGDPASGHPKELKIFLDEKNPIVVKEHDNKWATPICAVPGATLNLMLCSGFANQVYEIMTGCLIASTTKRSLTFPFRVLARRDATDLCYGFCKPSDIVDEPFDFLFDSEYFKANAGVLLTERHPDDTAVNITAAEKERYGFTPRVGTCSTSMIPHTYYSDAQHVLLVSPFSTVQLDNISQYYSVMKILKALRPAPRLAAVSSAICRAIGTTDWAVVHCRIEADWKRAFPNRVVGPSILIDAVREEIDHKRINTIYVMGETNNEEYWTALKVLAPEYKWVRKNDLAERIATILSNSSSSSSISPSSSSSVSSSSSISPSSSSISPSSSSISPSSSSISPIPIIEEKKVQLPLLGFDEWACVDREVALAAKKFIGFGHSTLSMIIALERDNSYQPYSFYGSPKQPDSEMVNPFFFFNKIGRPVFSEENKSEYCGFLSPLLHNKNKLSILVRDKDDIPLVRSYFNHSRLSFSYIGESDMTEDYKVYTCDFRDKPATETLISSIPLFDLIIDNDLDSHFISMFARLKENGLYLITRLDELYEEGSSIINVLKGFVDSMNAYHIPLLGKMPDMMTILLKSISFGDSVAVLRK